MKPTLILCVGLLITTLAITTNLQSGIRAEAAASGEETEENEREITLADVPDAALETLRREAAGHTIIEVEEVTIDGTVYYEAEWIVGSDEVDVTVSVDGTVVARETEPGDGDDD